jgi:hypothetical protein
MAPRTKTASIHPNHTTALRAGLSLLLLAVTAFLPYSVVAGPLAGATALPALPDFSLSIQNGDGSVLRGAYADDLFALPIIQQPDTNAGYVSTADNTLTQFGMASQFGNVGLLAHNYRSGQYFNQLLPGMKLKLIHGDGHIEYFLVAHVYRYRATSPFSVTSDFVDLDTQEYLTATDLFTKVYKGPRHVTFQTCISRDGNSSWGRLFVIAKPEPLFSKMPLILPR